MPTLEYELRDGSKLTISTDAPGARVGVAGPPSVSPKTVADFGSNGQKRRNANAMWRAFRQDDIGEAARETLAAALEEGTSSVNVFLTDVSNAMEKAGTSLEARAQEHWSGVTNTLIRAHVDTNWYDDTADADLIGASSAVIFLSQNAAKVPDLLLALATDLLRAHQRGYHIASLVGYRPFVFRSHRDH